MGAELLGEELSLDERATIGIQRRQLTLVVVAAVVFAFFQRLDCRLFTERRGASFDQLRERAPRA